MQYINNKLFLCNKINSSLINPSARPKNASSRKKTGLNIRFPAKFQLHYLGSCRIRNLARDEMSLRPDADWKAGKDTVKIGRLF